jgi:hypothetical protein
MLEAILRAILRKPDRVPRPLRAAAQKLDEAYADWRKAYADWQKAYAGRQKAYAD